MYGGFPTFKSEEELIALKKIENFFHALELTKEPKGMDKALCFIVKESELLV